MELAIIGRLENGGRVNREYPNAPLVGVGVVVHNGESVVLVERGKAPKKGLWAVPGGLVELGESVRDAAKREVEEECGISIELGDVISVVDLINKDESGNVQFHYILIDFTARWLSGELQAASDATDAKWVGNDELDNYDIPEITRKVIAKAFQ